MIFSVLRFRAVILALFFLVAGCAAKAVPSTPASRNSGSEVTHENRGPEKDRGAIALFNKAQDRIRAKDLDLAEALLRQAILKMPGLIPAHSALASLYEKKGKSAEAVLEYRKILHLAPGHVASHLALGRLAQKAGDEDRAIFRYEEAIRYGPKSFLAHYRLGLIRRRRGQKAMAAYHFNQAVRLSPGHQPANYWLWLTLAERGGTEKREIEIGRGLVESGNVFPIQFYRGTAARLFRAGRTAAALAAIQKAVEVNPNWRDRKWRGVLDDMARYRRKLGKLKD